MTRPDPSSWKAKAGILIPEPQMPFWKKSRNSWIQQPDSRIHTRLFSIETSCRDYLTELEIVFKIFNTPFNTGGNDVFR
jgi:hypothetical protein